MKNFLFLITFFFLVSCGLMAQQKTTGKSSVKPVPYRVGEWLPTDHAVLNQWMKDLIAEAEADQSPLLPVVDELKQLIENDPEVYMLFHQMFDQVPNKPPYNQDPTGKPEVRNYLHMLQLINQVMTKAPEFNKTGLVGFPINAILDWPMGTEAGASAFLNPKVNAQ
ncbi:MAG: phophatidylserine decarboxylase associated domain-containing protein, partial [Bacteroidales bacterium]